MKKTVTTILIFALVFSLCACRVRTTLIEPEAETQSSGETETLAAPVRVDAAAAELPQEEPDVEPQPEEASGEPTEQDEDTQRREYSQDASGELVPDAETPLYEPETEGTAPSPTEGGSEAANVEDDAAERTATETVSADEAEKLGADEDGETAESVADYYIALLDSRVGSLFECKRLYVYWECAEDHRTVYRTGREHELILLSGAYDVSSKLLEENLTVDDGWVVRKNPDLIVKVYDGEPDAASAEDVISELSSRPEWEGIGAVRNGRVVVVPSRLTETGEGRVAIAVYLAKLMYPGQLEDVDAEEALRELTGESGGIYPALT